MTASPAKLALEDGTVYILKEPPRFWAGRIIFTTAEGKSYSLNESEVDTIGVSPQTPTPRVTYSPMDSKSLGAIARQQREKKGSSAPLDSTKLGTQTQPDGTKQVTYNGHLLYTFVGDTAPGDANGQALGGVWFTISPAGDKVG